MIFKVKMHTCVFIYLEDIHIYIYQNTNNNFEYRISNLLNELEKYPDLKRIRYTTSHTADMTEDLIECYSSNKKLDCL